MARINIPVRRLAHGEGMKLPAYETAGAAGMDLMAAVDKPVSITPGARARIPTGIAVELPAGYEAQVRPRSGLAAKHGVTVLNSPGTIDSDYRDEIGVVLINHGETAFVVNRGERIAQLVVAPVSTVAWDESVELAPSARLGGFGSTGAA
jgi:dUTP pyrophosphatase